MPLELISMQVDIRKYPDEIEELIYRVSPCIVTTGDMHGNAMKLLYFLFKERVAKINREQFTGCEDADSVDAIFDRLWEIYDDLRNAKLTDQDRKDYLTEFRFILSKIGWIPALEIRLLGDIFADRGTNDLLTLWILLKLLDNKIEFEMLLGNHDAALLYDLSLLLKGEMAYGAHFAEQSSSAIKLFELIRKGIIPREYAISLIQKVASHIKLISYYLSPNFQHITIFTHAPNDFTTILQLAKDLGVKYKGDTINLAEYPSSKDDFEGLGAIKINVPIDNISATDWAQIIDRINARFQKLYKANKLENMLEETLSAHGTLGHFLWAGGSSPEALAGTQRSRYAKLIYAHVGEKNDDAGPGINLDTNLGKFTPGVKATDKTGSQAATDNHQGTYKVYITPLKGPEQKFFQKYSKLLQLLSDWEDLSNIPYSTRDGWAKNIDVVVKELSEFLKGQLDNLKAQKQREPNWPQIEIEQAWQQMEQAWQPTIQNLYQAALAAIPCQQLASLRDKALCRLIKKLPEFDPQLIITMPTPAAADRLPQVLQMEKEVINSQTLGKRLSNLQKLYAFCCNWWKATDSGLFSMRALVYRIPRIRLKIAHDDMTTSYSKLSIDEFIQIILSQFKEAGEFEKAGQTERANEKYKVLNQSMTLLIQQLQEPIEEQTRIVKALQKTVLEQTQMASKEGVGLGLLEQSSTCQSKQELLKEQKILDNLTKLQTLIRKLMPQADPTDTNSKADSKQPHYASLSLEDNPQLFWLKANGASPNPADAPAQLAPPPSTSHPPL